MKIINTVFVLFVVTGLATLTGCTGNDKQTANSLPWLEKVDPLIIENQGTVNIASLLVDHNYTRDTVYIGGYSIIGNLGRRTGGAELADFDIFRSPATAATANQVGGGAIVIFTG